MKQGQFTAAVFLLVSALIIGPTVVFPQVPTQINFQGRLTDDFGMPVPDSYYDMTFALYNTVSAGSTLWREEQRVAVNCGVYNVVLGKLPNEPHPWPALSLDQSISSSPVSYDLLTGFWYTIGAGSGCYYDYLGDGDVDGAHLAEFINVFSSSEMEGFALMFGRADYLP